jgi:hypothetical protein
MKATTVSDVVDVFLALPQEEPGEAGSKRQEILCLAFLQSCHLAILHSRILASVYVAL